MNNRERSEETYLGIMDMGRVRQTWDAKIPKEEGYGDTMIQC